jgi:hypothetical protein
MKERRQILMYKVQFTKQAGRSSQLSKDSYKKSNYSI